MGQRQNLKPIYACVLLALSSTAVSANPLDPTVVNGQASFATNGNTLTVTNTPGAIINWQGFSIGANETTRFAQQNAASAVLNRVISNNPSSILGTLQSNGRVFLINPNGIVFGAGAVVDVAGLVASTLNLSNADFLAGRDHYTQVPGAANVSNAGNITARGDGQSGGQVFLIAPNVENTGVITAPNGEILLAAGYSVDLVSTANPNLRVNITAPAGDATNVGQLIASSGSLGLFGTVVRNSGTVSADSATMQGGKIVFKASQRSEIAGTVSANGTTGGTIEVLGNQVGIMDGATVTANGTQGGGTILIGGDAHGANPDVPNAQITYVAPTATISADAIQNGNGGKVVVWADNTTQFNGHISAQGGALSGNGGWVEVSGKQKLSYAGLTNTLAPNGIIGTLLLDPFDFIIAATGGDMTGAILASNLAGGNVIITTALTGGMGTTGTLGNITVNDVVTFTGLNAPTLTLNAYSNIAINSSMTSTVGVLNIALNPGITQTGIVQTATISANVNTNGGTLSVAGSNLLIINAGTTTLNSANTFNNLTLTGTGVLTGTGAITINNTSGGINAGVFNWTGGTLSGTGTFSTTPGSPSPTAGFQPTATKMNGTLTLSRPFNNNGGMSQGAGALNLTVTSLGSLTNNATGTLILGNGAIGGSIIVNGTLSNLGGLGASGTGVSSVDASGATIGTISNTGTVAVAAGGTLNWTAGQTATSTGAWNIGSVNTPAGGGVLNLGEAAGAAVGTTQTYSGAFLNVGTTNVGSGTNILSGAFTNNGSLQFATGTNSLTGTYSDAQLAGGFMPNVMFTSGTNTISALSPAGGALTFSSMNMNGGLNYLNTASTINGLTLSAGTLTGLGNITVTGSLNWINGTLATTGVGAAAATITLNVGSVTTLGQSASTLNLNRTLINNGTVSIQGVNVGRATTLNVGAGGSFTNNGTFNLGNAVAGAVTVNVSDTGVFTNGATTGIINSAGAVTNAIQATLGLTTVGTITNSGAINVAAGNTLNYLGGQSATNAGTFTTVAGGVLNLGAAAGAPVGATYNYSSTITNNGTSNFTGGTNNLTNAVTAITGTGNLILSGGSLTLSAPSLSVGDYQQTGGILNVPATFALQSANNISVSSGMISSGGALTLKANNILFGASGLISSNSLNITAAGSVSLNTITANLTTSNTGIGGTMINNTGALASVSMNDKLGSIALTNAGAAMLNSLAAGGSVTVTTTGAGSNVNVGTVSSTLATTLVANGNMTLNKGSTINAGNANAGAAPVTLSATGGNFTNNSGSVAPITTTGLIKIYSTRPASDALNGMVSNYLLYNCTYAGGCPAGMLIPAGQVGFYYSAILASASTTVINEIVNTTLLLTISSAENKAIQEIIAMTDVKPLNGTTGQPLPMCN